MSGRKKEHKKQRTKTLTSQPATSSTKPFPIVGIGASAGGLDAFKAFFSALPAYPDPGMAFVLVQHLAPDHKSMLTELIQRFTRMQVCEATDGMTVQPNCIYIIPPNRDLALLNGTLQLIEPSVPRGQRLPVDYFFRSLAQDQHERAIGVVLSGTGSDGTLGVRAIKGEGGMVVAQAPESTEYDGMPSSAIATGLVDYTLPPGEIPAQLMTYAAHAFGKAPLPPASAMTGTGNALKKILLLLRAQTGHDFSQYKPSSVTRRIERRMALHQIELMDNYVAFMQQTPTEVEALFRDLLIGVTRFFRDPEALQALEEQVIPRLFAGKPQGATIRIWIPGCSTGEEAYSIAILLQERMEMLKERFEVQIFATDIDSRAIATARAGSYPASISTDISPERLNRFFTRESDGTTYGIHKSIRNLLIFSEQDVIRDPPFSKLDLISCRNLLIYMNGELQKKLLHLFYYSLNQEGYLFLGTSETTGEPGDLFATLDRTAKIFQRVEDRHHTQRATLRHFPPLMTMRDTTLPPTAANRATPIRLPLRELTEQTLLQQFAPAAALVNRQGDILYLHGRTGRYLEPAPGVAGINNILKMAREGLQFALTTALHHASTGKETVRRFGLRVKTNGDYTAINLTIRPVSADSYPVDEPLFLVTLEEAPLLAPDCSDQATVHAGAENEADDTETDARIEALRRELRTKEEYLHAANEELETSNEELKSSNEEMQSINEELQSTNEELATVNAELQTKVEDLSRANNDMNNLLAGTNIGTVFVDLRLRILRFTPAAAQIINLIAGDVGRPVGHLASNLRGYDTLVADTQAVLDTLIPQEKEVQTIEGKWYSLRIQPYRTLHNVIEGAVITFVDTTELKMAQEASRLAVVVRDAHDALTMQDLEGRIMAWNPSATRMYGWSEAEALAKNIRDLIPVELREDAQAKVQQLSRQETLEPYHTQRIAKDGTIVNVWITATALVNTSEEMYAIATTERTTKGAAHAESSS